VYMCIWVDMLVVTRLGSTKVLIGRLSSLGETEDGGQVKLWSIVERYTREDIDSTTWAKGALVSP